jgi:hypothetical protein
MDTDDFFSTIDSTLDKAAELDQRAGEMAAQNGLFLRELVPRLLPLFTTYRDKLRLRGVYAKLESYPTAVSLEMRYRDGGHYILHIGGELSTNRIVVREFFTSDDGKDHRSSDGNGYDRSTWNDSIAETALQKCIRDFLFYANRHGGPEVVAS